MLFAPSASLSTESEVDQGYAEYALAECLRKICLSPAAEPGLVCTPPNASSQYASRANLAPTNGHEARVKAPPLFIDHAIEHVKYSFAADEIQNLAYNVPHEIWPWQCGSTTRP